jgi:glycosyltransferase involved in cell wall biosynthesis
MDYQVTIIVPTYNRKAFSQLLVHNINSQSYKSIREVVVADDGDEPLDMTGCKYPVKYFKMNRIALGVKRNFLKNCVKSGYVACFDTDDFYNPTHIENAMTELAMSGKAVAGSADMLIYNREKGCFRQCCMWIDYLNEATLVFKSSYKGQFGSGGSSEGVTFLKDYIGEIVELKIDDVMVCVAHTTNTVTKDKWLDEKYVTSFEILNPYRHHLEILSHTIL